jgi:tetratricopeptide (TPR) repeat protein
MKVDGLMAGGDTNAALEAVAQAIEDPAFEADKPWLFRTMLQLLCMAGRVDDAAEKFLAAAGEDENLARAGFGIVFGARQAEEDAAALAAWTQRLNEAGLPSDLAVRAFAWHLAAVRQAGSEADVLALVPVCIERFGAGDARGLLDRELQRLLRENSFEAADALLAEIEKAGGGEEVLRNLVAATRVDILAREERWPEAEDMFLRASSGLPENELAACLQKLAGAAIRKGELELSDRLCTFILEQQPDRPQAVRVASLQWVAAAKARDDAAQVTARLGALLNEKGVSATQVFRLYRNEFYYVMGKDRAQILRDLLDVGDALHDKLESEDEKNQMRTMMLDGSFILEDYARSVKIIEQGIEGRDEAWHGMALNKVKAHLALQQGNHKEAVARFRDFMTYVEGWEQPEQDPSTGIVHTKEMTLGRNAKRIGDILKEAGDEPGAVAAYREAKDYYDRALAEVEKDSKSYEQVVKDMAELPADIRGDPAPADK